MVVEWGSVLGKLVSGHTEKENIKRFKTHPRNLQLQHQNVHVQYIGCVFLIMPECRLSNDDIGHTFCFYSHPTPVPDSVCSAQGNA
jgi:F420-0:gamma-glutamyl ligase-like protein